MKQVSRRERILLPVWAAVAMFVAINIVHYLRPVTCDDCFFPYGVPFTVYTLGGFAGGGGIVWSGVAGNFLAVMVTGLATGYMWNWLAAETRICREPQRHLGSRREAPPENSLGRKA